MSLVGVPTRNAPGVRLLYHPPTAFVVGGENLCSLEKSDFVDVLTRSRPDLFLLPLSFLLLIICRVNGGPPVFDGDLHSSL
jgi:hypothetical protein